MSGPEAILVICCMFLISMFGLLVVAFTVPVISYYEKRWQHYWRHDQ